MDTEYETPDLYLAAYLQASQVELLRADRRGGGRVFFVFRRHDDMCELLTGWINNCGTVAAQPYAQAVRSLKTLVHQVQ
jgi:hypothetical protein